MKCVREGVGEMCERGGRVKCVREGVGEMSERGGE